MKIIFLIFSVCLFCLSCKKEDNTIPKSNCSGVKVVCIDFVVATPTESESVTLKNLSACDQNISGWTLGDKNKPKVHSFPEYTIIKKGQYKVIKKSALGFQINDTNEQLFLKDKCGNEIDEWSN